MPKVFLIDDDADVCLSIAILLRRFGFECATYESISSFLSDWDYVRTQTGCLLIDLHLEGESGFALLDALDSKNFQFPFVMISGRGMIPDATTAMRRGAIDFLEKPFDPHILAERLSEGIRQDSERRERRSEERLYSMKIKSLTGREKQVLELVVQGKPTKTVAKELGIAYKTAEVHRGNLIRKMGVANTVELARVVSTHEVHESTADIGGTS